MKKVYHDLFENAQDCLKQSKVAEVLSRLMTELEMKPFGKEGEIKLCAQPIDSVEITGYRRLALKGTRLYVLFVDIDTAQVYVFEHTGYINREYYFGIQEPVISRAAIYEMDSVNFCLIRKQVWK